MMNLYFMIHSLFGFGIVNLLLNIWLTMQLEFTSFSSDDEDYEGYDFSLFGELSEVRIIYLNRFVQEVFD